MMSEKDRKMRLKEVCRCSFSNGIPRRSFGVSLFVGTILNLINQGDAIFLDVSIDWIKLLLTYLVPYFVATYGAVSALLSQKCKISHAA